MHNLVCWAGSIDREVRVIQVVVPRIIVDAIRLSTASTLCSHKVPRSHLQLLTQVCAFSQKFSQFVGEAALYPAGPSAYPQRVFHSSTERFELIRLIRASERQPTEVPQLIGVVPFEAGNRAVIFTASFCLQRKLEVYPNQTNSKGCHKHNSRAYRFSRHPGPTLLSVILLPITFSPDSWIGS